jgi:glutamine synthetase
MVDSKDVIIRRGLALPFGGVPEPVKTKQDSAQTLPAGLVERLIGRPPASWTESDLVDLVFDRGIRLISLMHVGGDGWLKTLDFVPRGLSHLKDILAGGERADGSSLFRGLGIRTGASDIVLRPRLETAFLDPFSELPTLVLMCAHHGRDGNPLPQSPQTIIERAAARLRETTGRDLWALGEVEYFLGKRRAESDIYGADDRGYHASSPFVFGEGLRRKALVVLAEIGVPVKYAHSEVGYIEAGDAQHVIWEQHEIELALAPLCDAARWVVLTQWVLRNLAHRQGMLCTFAPVLREGHAGNGLHFHLSPVHAGSHVEVRAADGALSDEARWLIGGLVRFGGGLMAFGNRTEASFLRLSQGKEAPRAIFWGEYDRGALIRLPIVPTSADGRVVTSSTVEFRLPDGSAHPHLLLAGVAQAMVQGYWMEDLDVLLQSTSSGRARAGGQGVSPLPRAPREVAELLAQGRAALEAGDVFPAVLIDEVLGRLGA